MSPLSIRSPYYAVGVTILACITIHIGLRRKRERKRLILPPGPKGYPLIGNLLDIPSIDNEPWKVYDEWRKIYGDIIYYEVMGQPFLMLGSLEVAQDLFDRRSSKYSSRPYLPMVGELMGWYFDFCFQPYGNLWRSERRVFHGHFHSGIVATYQPLQMKEAHIFLQLLLDTPEDFLRHIRHTFTASIMRVAYGIVVQPNANNIYVTASEAAVEGLSAAAIPGTFLVDSFPALRHVPGWFPGAGFKKKAAQWRKEVDDFIELPFNHVNELVKNGKALPSLLTKLLDTLADEKDPVLRAEKEHAAKMVPATAYSAGADTTTSSVQTFFLAMAMYPEVVKKAQAEIDAVVGSNRLPDFSDRRSLPYVNAICKETMRWQLVLNLSVSHMVSEDDEYRGYFIPKGTIVTGNSWGILHDAEVFQDPEEFMPERYIKDGKLDPTVRDPSTAAFGYGRRICPGRHFSDQNMYILIASTLATFDIKAPLDANGKPIKLEPKYITGLLSHPVPFKCRITPRSPMVPKLVQDSLDADTTV